MSKSDIASIHNDGYWTCMEEKMYQKIEGSGWESKCCSSRVKARKGLSVLTNHAIDMLQKVSASLKICCLTCKNVARVMPLTKPQIKDLFLIHCFL